MKSVLTINMLTRQRLIFTSCTPARAVFLADKYSTGQHNTWDFGVETNVIYGKHFAFCGHWAARLERER